MAGSRWSLPVNWRAAVTGALLVVCSLGLPLRLGGLAVTQVSVGAGTDDFSHGISESGRVEAAGGVTPTPRYAFSGEVLQAIDSMGLDPETQARVLAPTWCEIFGTDGDPAAPPLLVFSRWDEIGVAQGNECLYAASACWACERRSYCPTPAASGECCTKALLCGWNSERKTTDTYPRVYFHPGVGAWQLDTGGVGNALAAYEAVDGSIASWHAAQALGRRPNWWEPWAACLGGCCDNVFKAIYDGSQLRVTKDQNITALGGMVKWRCLWGNQPIDCYYLDPDLAQGRRGSLGFYNDPDGEDGKAPLASGFINVRSVEDGIGYEYRIWLQPERIYAKRILGSDARCKSCPGCDNTLWQQGIPAQLELPPLFRKATGGTKQLDLVLLVDTTGSMWDDIDAVSRAAHDIVDELFAVEGAAERIRVAIAQYKDFPIGPYGDPSDSPYTVLVPFTNDKTRLQEVLANLPSMVGGGADWEESVYWAVVSASLGRCLGERFSNGGWRDGAAQIILVIGDAPPHDPEPVSEFTASTVYASCLHPRALAVLDRYPCKPPVPALIFSPEPAGEGQQAPPERIQERAAPAEAPSPEDESETERRIREYQEWLASRPPQWPDDAWLAADRLRPTSVSLRWSQAHDGESEVVGYRIFEGSRLIMQVGASTTTYEVTGLTGGSTYTFSVQAGDMDGNWSEDGPKLEVTLPVSGVIEDASPPTWARPTLTAVEIYEHSVKLQWDGAVDSGTGVARYRVFRVGPLLEAEVPASQNTATVTGLASGTFYRFYVQAGDALGHWSTDGPSLTVRTALDPDAGQPRSVYSLAVGDDPAAVDQFQQLSSRTFGQSFTAPDPANVANTLIEILQQVTDTNPPELHLPGNLVFHDPSCAGRIVTFTVTATDDVDGDVPVSCEPPSGSSFPPGATIVTCRASDSAGNTSEGSFEVMVRCSKGAPAANALILLSLAAVLTILGLLTLGLRSSSV